MRHVIASAAAALLAGCASLDGSSLVPGQSRSADVEALMGRPAEQITLAGGESVWFYPRGRQTYAVTLGAGGVVRSVEARLTVENMHKLAQGSTSSREARALLGPPLRVSRLERQQREVWEYPMYDARGFEYSLYVQFSADGIVREVLLLRDLYFEPGGGAKD
jgi:hypothetical protein